MSELTNIFTGLANAIRSKTGGSDKMTPSQMITEISNIPSEGGLNTLIIIASSESVSGTPSIITFGVDAKFVLAGTYYDYNNSSDFNHLFDIENNRFLSFGNLTGQQFNPPSASLNWVNGLTQTNTDLSVTWATTKNQYTFTNGMSIAAKPCVIVFY